MTDDNDKDTGSHENDVVSSLLSELGVDEEMKQELIDSGRLSGDIFKVESGEEVRRRMEIDKSNERLRDNIKMVERDLATLDSAIDKIERELIPVILSFLVGLKGNLVNLKESVISRSKRRAKTNLQLTYVEKEVKSIVEEEFSKIEETLTSGMSTPVLDKTRDLTDGLKENLKQTSEELQDLKASTDDFLQRASTEIEFLTKALSIKPKVEVPKEVSEKLKSMERSLEELDRDLTLTKQKLDNRESQIEALQESLESEREKNEALEERLAKLRSEPTADTSAIAELRQTVKSLEASRDLLKEKVEEANRRAEESDQKTKEILSQLAKKELELEDARSKVSEMEGGIEKTSQRLAEIDDLKARIRSYESGDKARELDRVTGELERVAAAMQRTTRDYDSMKAKLEHTQEKLEGYLNLMENTEKTKAFLMIEENREMSLREIQRSLGISPAQVRKWAEEFERLGIAKFVDDDTLVLANLPPED
ncbi:hypothetical protein EU538_09215 [Candidatus Thorarchaeota archaeon]|nr:MAG: hypothetical protein EU538_09215 [Candidatus Thorarchaeota archaeon]